MKTKSLIFSFIFTAAFCINTMALPQDSHRFERVLNNPFTTTWFPQEFECPIDKQKNTFMVWGSYGSYIYSWPSKYQWVFFPWTSQNAYYICKKCHLATFLGDFDTLPKEKLPEIRKLLADIKVSKEFKDYNELPASERMEAIEKVYSVLGKDEEWWENFYRLKGYHYGQEGNTEKANIARKKSLEMINKFISGDKTEMPKKLLFYISGAMKHFMSDDEGAISDLKNALKTKYEEKGAKPEDAEDAEKGLNQRLEEYIEKIKTSKSPRATETKSDDDH